MAVGCSEAETFWTEFLRTLARRGLRGGKRRNTQCEGDRREWREALGRHEFLRKGLKRWQSTLDAPLRSIFAVGSASVTPR